MLEFYQAYATYADLMDLTEEMIAGLAHDVNGGTKVVQDGVELELAAPWQRLTIREAVRTLGHVEEAERVFEDPLFAAELAVTRGVAGAEVLRVLAEGDLESSAEVKALEGGRLDAAALANVARRMIERYPNHEEARVRAGHLGYLVFEATAERHLVQPTFLTEFPVAVSPLARRNDSDPAFCDRFELFVNGRELANAFSELNDPTDQRARFQAQLAARTAGAHETMDYDEDYCRALEVGMPPAAGEGVGIDRLTMLLTGQPSIRDVILFPLMRPE
jgi:lysyl-tRNA synthetase class 2